jgi:protein-tyrosine phosphatase
VNESQRVLAIKGIRNLRDVGGYPTTDGRVTRWRTVWRSGVLHGLDAAAQKAVLGLGLKTVIDLRARVELEHKPNVFGASAALSYRWVPFKDPARPDDSVDDGDVTTVYQRALAVRGKRMVAAVRELVEPMALPALVHCAAGKDRTGLLVAVLLAALRVPSKTIVDDYVLSRTCLGQEYLDESRALVAQDGRLWEEVASMFDTPPQRMQLALDYLEDRWGGAERYLLDHGLAVHELDALREALTTSV